MPVVQKRKTNIDYLRELIQKHVGDANKDESLEFLESIENEFDEVNDELKTKEVELNSKDSEIEELSQEMDYEDTIDVLMGPNDNIRWSAGNIACKSMMEELDNAISRGIPILKIENVLRAL